MAALTLGAMYAQRRSPKLGLLGFAVGFVVTMFLAYGDAFPIPKLPTPEKLVRIVCWFWVILAYPSVLLILCESTFGGRPEVLLRRGLAFRLAAVGSFLEATPEDPQRTRRRVERLQQIGVESLAPFTAHGPPGLAPLRRSLVGEVQSLLVLAGQTPPLPATSPLRALLGQASATCHRLAQALLEEKDLGADPPPEADAEAIRHQVGDADAPAAAAVLSVLGSVRTLAMGLAQLRAGASISPPPPAAAPPPSPLELAAQKQEALQYACKVTLAAMTAYILYTALDWRGIHTAIITCFFIAQDSIGATIHKSTLRFTGALIGGALGIASLVFVLPHLDSGGALALLCGAVTLLATWFATGSERISYCGWQIALAFYLVVLQGYSRTTEMVKGRDRILGILIGNFLMSIVFLHLWPVRMAPKVQQGIGRALDALAGLLSLEGAGPEAEARGAQLEQAFVGGLEKAGQVAFVGRFEPGGADRARMLPPLSGLLIPVRALSLATPGEGQTAASLPEGEHWRIETVTALRRALAHRVSELAVAVREGRAANLNEGKDAFAGPLRSLDAVRDPALRKSEAPLRMQLEWLAMIGDRLEVLGSLSGRVATAGAAR
jgi:multidrug resistance protein MdtO